jgi:hypothetical protein
MRTPKRSGWPTKAGIWARIHVTRGSIECLLHAPFHTSERLTPDLPGVVPPGVEHYLRVSGAVSIFLELWHPAGVAY